jgi:hypothetical protein
VKQVTEGKGAKKKTYKALILSGEWSEDDQVSLLAQNPEKKETDEGEEDNPGHEILKKAIKKWNDAWKKVQKKLTGADENEVPE